MTIRKWHHPSTRLHGLRGACSAVAAAVGLLGCSAAESGDGEPGEPRLAEVSSAVTSSDPHVVLLVHPNVYAGLSDELAVGVKCIWNRG